MALRRWLLENVAPAEQEQAPATPSAGPPQARQLGLHPAWLPFLRLTPQQVDALWRTTQGVRAERRHLTVYPNETDVHRWSHLCRPYDTRVVIVNHEPECDGSATGVAFGTAADRPPTAALQAIYAELSRTVPEFRAPRHGCLDAWGREGVLLLNTVFTVVRNQPGSHEYVGWSVLCNRVLRALSDHRDGLVFLLWGVAAQEHEYLLDPLRHLILRCGHPSPEEDDVAANGRHPFWGCRHFVLANEYLLRHGHRPVDWAIVCPSTRESRRPHIPLLTGALPSDEEEEGAEEATERPASPFFV